MLDIQVVEEMISEQGMLILDLRRCRMNRVLLKSLCLKNNEE